MALLPENNRIAVSPREPPQAPDDLNRDGRRHGAVAPLEPIAVGPRQAAALLGISVPTMYELLNSGKVPSVKVGARRLIATSALRALVEPAA